MRTLLLACAALTTPLTAATWHVDQSVAASGDGTSWGSAFATLQEGLAAAAATDTILVAAGSYHPDEGGSFSDNDEDARFELVEGVTIEGGYPAGGGARDLSAHETILSGDLDQNDSGAPAGSNSQTVVYGIALTSATVLDGLHIRGGLADGPGEDAFDGPTRAGGGMYLTDASPTVVNCRFSGNEAGFGGGVFCIDDSDPSFTNCVFSGNLAGFFGGGLNNRDGSSPTLVNCTMSGNSAESSSGGGAITNFAASNPVLTNCILWNNRANGETTTAVASVNDGGSTSTTYHHSLVHNIDPGGTNLDGTNPGNAPGFLLPSPPNQAPQLDGDLRLETGSPALDAGDNAANLEATDLVGAARIQNGTIDLGAYEGDFTPVIPEVLHVDASNGSPGDGTSWATAFTTLQDALAVAIGDQQILVATGTYHPDEGGAAVDGDRAASFVLLNGIEILGGYPSGGGIRNLATSPTILSGDIDQNDTVVPAGDNSYSVVRGQDLDATAVLDGFIITGGLADETEVGFFEPDFSGGGVHLDAASPTIRNCWLRGNRAKYGAGIQVKEDGAPVLVNCAISGNLGDSYGGGTNIRHAAITLVNCTVSGNEAGISGGGLYGFSSTTEVWNSIVWNNAVDGDRGDVLATLAAVGGSTSFEYSLAQHLDPGGTALDGTTDLNNPLFVLPIDPGSAPSAGGDFRLSTGTPCLNAGDNSANSEMIDLGGLPRRTGTIDLGAHEGAVPPGDADNDGLADPFELAFTQPPSATALAPSANADGDDFSALEEFAFGLSPDRAEPSSAAYQASVTDDGGVDYLSIIGYRRPTSMPFVTVGPEQSLDLGITDPWSSAGLVPLGLPAPMIGARSSTPIGSEAAEFLRFRVEKN